CMVRVVLCGVATGAVLASSGVASAATIPPRKQLLHAINHVRTSHGMARLRGAHALRSAALRHSEDMVARDYFAHTSPTGSTFTYRILPSGVVRGPLWPGGANTTMGSGAL